MSSSTAADQAHSQSGASHASGDRPSPTSKKCRVCRRPFVPRLSTQVCCQYACAITYAKLGGEKRQSAAMKRCAEAARKEERAAHREAKKKLLTIPQLKKLADKEFGKYIRERDFGRTCICCDEYAKSGEGDLGGVYDAGHYRTKGAADHLRYNEDNAHLQRKYCNKWRSGNQAAYRVRLIEKIGYARVELLEDDNRTVKWTREELIAIRKDYLNRWKQLKKAREQA